MDSKLPDEIKTQIEHDGHNRYRGKPDSHHPSNYKYVDGYIDGATEWAIWKVKHDELRKETDDLNRWKREACMVIDPIIEYGQGHKDAKLGRSITEFVIERCKDYDRIKDKADKMEAALQNIAMQKTCEETENDPDGIIGSDGKKMGYIEVGYDCCIEEARKALAWKEEKEVDRFEGTVSKNPAPGIAICCISPEARDLLDTIMEKWEEHYKKVKTKTYEPTFYGFAYWLVRWSELIKPKQ